MDAVKRIAVEIAPQLHERQAGRPPRMDIPDLQIYVEYIFDMDGDKVVVKVMGPDKAEELPHLVNERRQLGVGDEQEVDQMLTDGSLANDIHEWVSLIRSSMGIDKLDRELLIKLVDKIVVGQKTVVDGVERQEITIIYSLVGQID